MEARELRKEPLRQTMARERQREAACPPNGDGYCRRLGLHHGEEEVRNAPNSTRPKYAAQRRNPQLKFSIPDRNHGLSNDPRQPSFPAQWYRRELTLPTRTCLRHVSFRFWPNGKLELGRGVGGRSKHTVNTDIPC